jgi:hypothetical protein
MTQDEKPEVVLDVDLERVLDEMEDDFDKTEAFGRWMPPAGAYTVAVSRTQSGTFVSKPAGGKSCPYVAVYGTIQAGELEKKEFQLGYFALDIPVKKSIAKGAANTIAGRDTEDWKDVITVLKNSVGTVLEVKVVEQKDKNSDRIFKNVRINQVLD